MGTRLALAAVLLAGVLAAPVSAQPSAFQLRTVSSQRTGSRAGPVGVRRLGGSPSEVRLRAQWFNGGVLFSKVRGTVGMAALELDLREWLTLRGTLMAGVGAPTSNDGDRMPLLFGDVGVFLHFSTPESFREHVTLSFRSSRATSTVGATQYTRTSSRETYVEVPALRRRMRGLNLRGFAYWGMGHPGDGETPDPNDVYAPVVLGGAYAGFSSAFVKSTAYWIEGYGLAGGARFHRLYADVLMAPLRHYTEGQSEVSGDAWGQLLGARFGVENVWGKRVAFAARVEAGVLPARLGGYLLATLGIGSNLVRR